MRGAAARSVMMVLARMPGDQAATREVEAGIASALGPSGEEAVLALLDLADDAEAALRRFLSRHRPLGVVLAPPLGDRDALERVCRELHTPCVRIGHPQGPFCDERRVAFDMVGWLVAQGHARIGLVAGAETATGAQQRELGYLDAMAEHGLDRGPSLIVGGDGSFASGIEAAQILLEISPRPTAILACNDEMAAGALHAAAQAGMTVPGDISVASLDDTPLARLLVPPLSAMHVPWRDMGREAVLSLLSGQERRHHPTFAAVLTERQSVATIA